MRSASWAAVAAAALAAVVAVGSLADDRLEGEHPIADQAAADPALEEEFRPASLHGVTPGKTKVEKLQEVLGKPAKQQVQGEETLYEFQIGPFPRVEVTAKDGIVASIVIHLLEPLPVAHVVGELGLGDFEAVPVRGDQGELLGQVYPERGVSFSHAEDRSDAIAQLILEPISAEPFWMRMAARGPLAIQSNLNTLQQIVRLEPDNAQAYAQLAALLTEAGYFESALAAAEGAHDLAPQNHRYTLMLAQVLAEMGEQQEALSLTRKVLDAGPEPIIQAGAQCQLGDLLVAGRHIDYPQAIEHHLKAVKLAAPLANAKDSKVRREAKLVLVDAHLSVANNIARGPWKQKTEVVPQWIRGAEEVATSAIAEGALPTLMLLVHRRSLDAYAAMGGTDDMLALFKRAERQADKIVRSVNDEMFAKKMQWEMAQAAIYCVRALHRQAKREQALQIAQQAVAWVETQPIERHASPTACYLIGQLYFQVGAIYAVHHQDHDRAVRWYERALPFLSQHEPPESDLGLHGERFVSMGVSYWETGVQNEGLDLTRRGLDLMQQALEAEYLDEYALAVPFTNLAAMYRKLGREDKAREYEARAARLERRGDRTR